MKLLKISEIKQSFLRSRVARRIFFLFIICALIPLSALAYFSFSQVTKELYLQADNRLRQASKASGMSIIEHLSILEDDLNLITSNIHKGKSVFLASPDNNFTDSIKERFKGLALMTDGQNFMPLWGNINFFPSLKKEEIEHINSGKTLFTTRPSAGKFASIFIVKSLGPAQSSKTLLIGKINTAYLWNEASLSPMTEVHVLDESNNVLFASPAEYTPLEEVKTAMRKNPALGEFTWTSKGITYIANYRMVFMRPQFNTNWILVQSESQDDIISPIITFKKIFLLLIILTFLIVLFLSLSQIRRNLIPIETLQEATRRIAAKDFKNQVQIKTNDEFEELGAAFNEMTASLDSHFHIMTTLNNVGIALSAEKNNNHLLEFILISAKNIINADGCALYTLTDDKQLKLSFMHIDSINFAENNIDNTLIPLYDKEGNPNTSIVAAYSIFKDETVNIPDIYALGDFNFFGNCDFDRQIGYESRSFLCLPLKDHENEIIGVLQLINAKSRTSNVVIPFSDEDQRLLETLASQAAVALSKNRLIEDFKKLFDSLVELIATAIDEKSPHTGDHCKRVPELTLMLADAVSNSSEGKLRDFTLSEEERYEIKIAALLHDCGKVTTPVHIVDKATRLETIFDRIHIINTRFEVLRRDTQTALLHKKIGATLGENERARVSLEEEMEKSIQQIDDDRNFVITCNSGDTFMDCDRKKRVRDIASKYKWINASGNEEPILSEEEVYILTSAQGTITPDDRVIINKHVETTGKMLESLHYPKALRNVPLFAQAHHEHMDGNGYPKGLVGDQIPVQARIIAIADIFEALTAKSRPYKKGKTLMEALQILGSMKQQGHIDPDIFNIFIREKVYLPYAEKYLSNEQLDEVVPSQIPGYLSQHINQLFSLKE